MKLEEAVLKENHVLVERDKVEEKTASGIYIPNSEDLIPQYSGKIIKVSKNVSLKAGQQIIYKKWDSLQVTLDKKDYDVVDVDSIILYSEEQQ